MKKALIPVLILLAAAILGTLIGCEPNEDWTIQNEEVVLVHIGNDSTYYFGDKAIFQDWVIKENGDGYSFIIRDGVAEIISHKPIEHAIHSIGTMRSEGEILPVSAKNSVKAKLEPYSVFTFKYE